MQAEERSNKPWRNQELMAKLYMEEDLSGYEIAEKFGCNNQTIYNWLRKHGIKELDGVKSKAASGELCNPKLASEDWLRKKYECEEMSIRSIAKELNCSSTTVSKHIDRHGIRKRSNEPPGPEKNGYYSFRTTKRGYERWGCGVSIHRLAAVAWFGIEAVVNKQVHHKNGIEWDNRQSNLQPLSPSDHSKIHAEESPTGSIGGVTLNLKKAKAKVLRDWLESDSINDSVSSEIATKINNQLNESRTRENHDD